MKYSVDGIQENLLTSIEETDKRLLIFATRFSTECLHYYTLRHKGTQKVKYEMSTSTALCYARNLFHMKEYEMAIDMLSGLKEKEEVFARIYIQLISGEKHIEELKICQIHGLEKEEIEALTTEKIKEKENHLYTSLLEEVEYMEKDSFLYYLNGILLTKINRFKKARDLFIVSINMYSFNWSCWVSLENSIFTEEQLEETLSKIEPNENTVFLDFFRVNCYRRLYIPERSLEILGQIEEKFGRMIFTIKSMADIFYTTKDYNKSIHLYKELMIKYPGSLDAMDQYSDILYIQEDIINLTNLAKTATELDPYRVETNYILGNYHSLNGDREKAILHFKRAISLDKHYMSAWILLGHEWIECKNPEEAIKAYKTATEINQLEYRAWFGLGQTYEMLTNPMEAIYHYRKAVLIKKEDTKIWLTIGNCYETLENYKEAIMCYIKAKSKAIKQEDVEMQLISITALAQCYEKTGHQEKAVENYLLWINHFLDTDIPIKESAVDACLYVSLYYKNIGNWREAIRYASLIVDFQVPEKEKINDILNFCYKHIKELENN